MFASRPRVAGVRPIGPNQSLLDMAWRFTWPFLIANILACAMILFAMIIIALEIASLAKSTNTTLYGNTSSTGAGIWCGIFFIIAAVVILMINLTPLTRLWATFALIATIIAACFAVILLGLDAKAVQDGHELWISQPSKTKTLAAQLAFAIVELLLCIAIILIYIAVAMSAYRRIHLQPRLVRTPYYIR